MRSWPVPVQITDEEKIIGGVLTLRQLVYMIAGLAVGGALAAVIPTWALLRFLIYLVFQIGGFALALCQVKDMSLDSYLVHYWKWKHSARSFILKGDNDI